MVSETLCIIYNADATLMGKLKYGYKKISSSSEENPACAACDITNGGLSIKESPKWLEAKKVIESESGLKIVQWHRDEVPSEAKEFITSQSIRYPTVLKGSGSGQFEQVLSNQDLIACKGEPNQMIDALRQKGIMKKDHASL